MLRQETGLIPVDLHITHLTNCSQNIMKVVKKTTSFQKKCSKYACVALFHHPCEHT